MLIFVILAAFLFLSLMTLSFWLKLQKQGVPFHRLFDSLRMKLYMTVALLLFFSGLFLLINSLLSWSLNKESFLRVFHLGKNHLSLYIYLGVAILVFNSLLILLIRSIIRSLYRMRR